MCNVTCERLRREFLILFTSTVYYVRTSRDRRRLRIVEFYDCFLFFDLLILLSPHAFRPFGFFRDTISVFCTFISSVLLHWSYCRSVCWMRGRGIGEPSIGAASFPPFRRRKRWRERYGAQYCIAGIPFGTEAHHTRQGAFFTLKFSGDEKVSTMFYLYFFIFVAEDAVT